jgi:hypothetical protein
LRVHLTVKRGAQQQQQQQRQQEVLRCCMGKKKVNELVLFFLFSARSHLLTLSCAESIYTEFLFSPVANKFSISYLL